LLQTLDKIRDDKKELTGEEVERVVSFQNMLNRVETKLTDVKG
jgi:hypothetical protein